MNVSFVEADGADEVTCLTIKYKELKIRIQNA
jgi:hypothetical protein